MKTRKKLFTLLLALCMALTLIPPPIASAASESEDEEENETTYTPAVMPGSVTATGFVSATTTRMTLQQLQDKFPDGKYWNGGNVDSYTTSPCPSHATTAYCNHYDNASQCYGFALKLGWDAYGTNPRTWNYSTSSSYVDSLKPGDIVDNSGSLRSESDPYHTVFVIGVTDTEIMVGECNKGGNCIIKWGRTISKSAIKNYRSLKIYIAPSELPIDNTPKVTKITASAPYAMVGDNVTFNFPATNATLYELVITNMTTQKRIQYTMLDTSTFTQAFWSEGTHKIEVNAYGTKKIVGFEPLYFEVRTDTSEITVSPSSVSVPVGASTTVTIGTKSPGTIYLKAYTSSSSICGGSWGSWNSAGTERLLTLTGKGEGNATVTVRMYDANTNAELTSKTIAVKVTPVPKSQISVETLTTLNRVGTASLYPTVFKGYLRGTAKYDAYSDSSGTNNIGRIYITDELKVQSVYAYNGALWMSALCPWDGYSSDRLIYTKLDAVVDTNFAPYTAIASSSATVYVRSDASRQYGSLGSGDAVTVVGQAGQYSQVIYPLAAGGYKIGWCATNSLTRPNISAVTATSSTSARFTYTLSPNATNSLVIMDANMNVRTRGVIRGSSVGVSKMKPGVTYYVYIESVLSNGTGTVTSPVKKIVLQ